MLKYDFEIIDFHTHPYTNFDYNISNYRSDYAAIAEDIKRDLSPLGISKIAGSFINLTQRPVRGFDTIKKTNDDALDLARSLGGYYIPGFHIHPDYVSESIEEVHRMAAAGVNLIGELVPYLHSWKRYDEEGIFPILEEAAKHKMILSFHTQEEDSIEPLVSAFPDITFVAAHPGEHDGVLRHIERMKRHENLCLDISGTGIFRWQMLRYLVDTVGSERILFGSDYPVCNPGVCIGGVLAENISDEAKENIFSKNAKRILKI